MFILIDLDIARAFVHINFQPQLKEKTQSESADSNNALIIRIIVGVEGRLIVQNIRYCLSFMKRLLLTR